MQDSSQIVIQQQIAHQSLRVLEIEYKISIAQKQLDVLKTESKDGWGYNEVRLPRTIDKNKIKLSIEQAILETLKKANGQ